jgi:hypothetical protein
MNRCATLVRDLFILIIFGGEYILLASFLTCILHPNVTPPPPNIPLSTLLSSTSVFTTVTTTAVCSHLLTLVPRSRIFSSTLKMEAIRSSETSVYTHLHSATSQKTAFLSFFLFFLTLFMQIQEVVSLLRHNSFLENLLQLMYLNIRRYRVYIIKASLNNPEENYCTKRAQNNILSVMSLLS